MRSVRLAAGTLNVFAGRNTATARRRRGARTDHRVMSFVEKPGVCQCSGTDRVLRAGG
jgi:hypothetical protein